MNNVTTINEFNLTEHLTDQPIITEVDTFGDTWRHKETQISEGVTLFLYDSGQAALRIGEDASIEFLFTDEIAEVFSEINNVTAIELFAALHRNKL